MPGLSVAWVHIEHDGKVGHEAVRNHHRAVAADLFLHGIDRDHGRGHALLFLAQALHDFSDDEAADAVVDGAAHEFVVADKFSGVGVNHERGPRRMPASATSLALLTPISTTSSMRLRHLFVLAIPNADGGVADDAAHHALFTQDVRPSATASGGGIRATHTGPRTSARPHW